MATTALIIMATIIYLFLTNMVFTYSDMTCFQDTYCICLDSICETNCQNGFCQNKEFVCTKDVTHCSFNCQDTQSCKDSTFHIASNEFYINCTGSNSCQNISINCGLARVPPGGLSINDFDDKMQTCGMTAFPSSINNSYISCNGDIDNCYIESHASTKGAVFNSEFECSIDDGVCELNCDYGCYESLYLCDTFNDNQCKCNGCDTGITIETIDDTPTIQPTSSPTIANLINGLLSTTNNQQLSKTTLSLKNKKTSTTESNVIVDIDTDITNKGNKKKNSTVSNADATSPNFDLADEEITHLEILYYIVLGAGGCLLCCVCLCISVVCFVRHSMKKKIIIGRKIKNEEDMTGIKTSINLSVSGSKTNQSSTSSMSTPKIKSKAKTKKSKSKRKKTNDRNGNYNSDIDDEDESFDEDASFDGDEEEQIERMTQIVNEYSNDSHKEQQKRDSVKVIYRESQSCTNSHIINISDEEKAMTPRKRKKNKHSKHKTSNNDGISQTEPTMRIELTKPRRRDKKHKDRKHEKKNRSSSRSGLSKKSKYSVTDDPNYLSPDTRPTAKSSDTCDSSQISPISPISMMSMSNPDPNEGTSMEDSSKNIEKSYYKNSSPSMPSIGVAPQPQRFKLMPSNSDSITLDSQKNGKNNNPFAPSNTAQFEKYSKQINEMIQNYTRMSTSEQFAAMQRHMLHQNQLMQNQLMQQYQNQRSYSMLQNKKNNPFSPPSQQIQQKSHSMQKLQSTTKSKSNLLGIPPPPEPKPEAVQKLQMIKPSMRHKRTVTPSAPKLPVIDSNGMETCLNPNSSPAPPSIEELTSVAHSSHRYTSTNSSMTSTTSGCSSGSGSGSSSVSSSCSSSSSVSDDEDGSCSCSDCNGDNHTESCRHSHVNVDGITRNRGDTNHTQFTQHTNASCSSSGSSTSICHDPHCSCHKTPQCTTTICSSSIGSSSSCTSSTGSSSLSESRSRTNSTMTVDSSSDDSDNTEITKTFRSRMTNDKHRNVENNTMVINEVDEKEIRQMFDQDGMSEISTTLSRNDIYKGRNKLKLSVHERQYTGNSSLTATTSQSNDNVKGDHVRYKTLIIHDHDNQSIV